MFGNHFYHNSIRRTVAVFGTLFNDINVLRRGADGSASNIVKVPLAYGPKQKFLARLDQGINLDDPKIALKLPRMSFELTSMTYDTNTKLQKGIRQKIPGTDPTKQSSVLGPVGYRLGIELSIIAKNQDDALQILEQIVPYFQPDYTVTVKEVNGNFKSDQPYVLSAINITDDYEGDFTTRRAIVYTLSFDTKVNFYGPTEAKGIIRQVNVDYNNINNVTSKPIERQVASIDPTTAQETDVHTVVNTISLPHIPDAISISFTEITGLGGFTVGETITASASGMTGIVESKTGNTLNLTNVTGTLTFLDRVTGGTSGAFADVSNFTSYNEFWNND